MIESWTTPARALALPVTAAIPVVGVLLLLIMRHWPNARETASVIAGLALAGSVLSLWPHAGAGLRFTLWDWLPGLSLEFALEPLGLIYATVAAVLWPITTIFAAGYLRGEGAVNQTRFYSFFAITIAAAMWIALSGNLITLFIGYEIMTLVTWPLVTHDGDETARRGGRTYLAVLLTTSIGLFLPAIVWTQALTGSTEFTAGGLLTAEVGTVILTVLYCLYLFGIGKAALMPVHRWLPAAMVAPTPVSALLHAVAVVKAGVFAVLKITVYVFGLDTLAATGASKPMMWVAAFTLIAAAVVAIRSDNLKRRLAYSTVSQLGYIVLAATLARDIAIAGGALHLVTHAAAKITLFMCAGAIAVTTHRRTVSSLDGLGRTMPVTFAAFLVASVSIVGLPPLGGTWSKWLLLLGTVDADQLVMLIVLLLGSLLALGYLLPIPVRGFFRSAAEPDPHGEATLSMTFPLTLTALACFGLFLGADAVLAPLHTILELP